MDKLSTKVADFFVQNKVIEEEEYDICRYGLEIMLGSARDIILLVFLGIFFRRMLETGIYLAVFCSLRRYTGGYHARTRLGCRMATLAGYLLFIIEIKLFVSKMVMFDSTPVVMGIIYIICLGVIYYTAPIEHCNKALTEMKKRKNRQGALREMFLLGGGIVFLYSNLPEVSFAILVTLIEVALLMIIGRRENGRRKENCQTDCRYCD